jgi:hypothetical protein
MTDKQEEYNIKLVTEGKVEFVGLPEKFVGPIAAFTDDEKRNQPLLTLQAAIRAAEQGPERNGIYIDKPTSKDGKSEMPDAKKAE